MMLCWRPFENVPRPVDASTYSQASNKKNSPAGFEPTSIQAFVFRARFGESLAN